MTYMSPPRLSASRPNLEDLPNLFVEAAQGLNHSLKLLVLSTKTAVNASSHSARMGEVAELLRNATLLDELRVSELGLKLLAGAGNYSKLANAAKYTASAAEMLSSTRDSIKEFLEGVRTCNFSRARRAAPLLEESVGEATSKVKLALFELEDVSEDALLSEGHRAIYREASTELSKWLKALSNLARAARLISILDEHQLSEVCTSGKRPDNFTNDAILIAKSLEPGDSGEYGYEIGLLKSLVLGREGGTVQPGTGSGMGTGAGWGEPKGDD